MHQLVKHVRVVTHIMPRLNTVLVWEKIFNFVSEEFQLTFSVSSARVHLSLDLILDRLRWLANFAFLHQFYVRLKLESLDPGSPISDQFVARESSLRLKINMFCLKPSGFCYFWSYLLGCVLERVHGQRSQVHS